MSWGLFIYLAKNAFNFALMGGLGIGVIHGLEKFHKYNPSTKKAKLINRERGVDDDNSEIKDLRQKLRQQS